MLGKLNSSLHSSRVSASLSRGAAFQTCLPNVTHRTVSVTSTKHQTTTVTTEPKQQQQQQEGSSEFSGLGDLLGPIGLTYSGGIEAKKDSKKTSDATNTQGGGLALGPISLSFGSEFGEGLGVSGRSSHGGPEAGKAESIHSMTTEEWRRIYEKDGTVDLWVEEEFNAGSRLVGGRDVHKGGMYGIRTGEGPSISSATKHHVRIHNHYADQVVDVEVPEDRYILWEAEDEGLQLPYACRMGCCTACAVRIKEGEMYQPEALGISAELREQGYGLMCVGYPLTDMVLETVPEDEVYELQFGSVFDSQALDPANSSSIERDDFALEIANMDE